MPRICRRSESTGAAKGRAVSPRRSPGPVSSSPGLARPRPGLATREVALLLILAAGAWAATVAIARGMNGMTGTMGFGLAVFVPIWTLMMAAMMLPSVAPTASLYAKTMQSNRTARVAGLVVGYLAVWAAAGLPAYGLARLTGWLTGLHPGAAHILAVAVFAVAGLYQLSPLKDRCLAHCRSPLGLLLHYGSYRGRSRDLRVGVHHGGYCLGCPQAGIRPRGSERADARAGDPLCRQEGVAVHMAPAQAAGSTRRPRGARPAA